MDKKRLEVDAAYVLFITLIISLFFIESAITGYTIFDGSNEKVWDFNNSLEYSYDDSLINLSDGEAKLKQQIIYHRWNTTTILEMFATSAVYVDSEKIDDVNEIDNQHVQVSHSNIFNVYFNDSLDNGDTISLYLKPGTETQIYLCEEGLFCDYPGFGAVLFDGSVGWHNITIANLEVSTSIFNFNLDSDKNIGVNYLEAVNILVEEHMVANTTYFPIAEIETNDLENSGLGLFNKEEILNGQLINYYYSTDSGSKWKPINFDDFSSIDSEKIRIKAVLESNTVETPILKSISLEYLIPECVPVLINTSWSNWSNANECYSSNKLLQSRFLVEYDSNECNLTEDKTYYEYQEINCTYVAPVSTPVSSSGGGSRSYIAPPVLTTTNEKIIETSSESEEYNVEISLSDNSLINNDAIEITILNNGKDIDKLELDLSQELIEFASISNLYIENLKKGEQTIIYLVKKIEIKGNMLTGFVTETIKTESIITGNLIFNIDENFKEEVVLELAVLNTNEEFDENKVALEVSGLFVLVGAVFMIYRRRKLNK